MRTCLLVLLLLLAPASWAQNTETGLEGTTPLTTDDEGSTEPTVTPTAETGLEGTTPLTADDETLTEPTATPTTETVSEAMLTSFVASLLEIQPLLEEASTALLATDSDTERQALEQDFESQAIAIIDTNELSVADYRRLITLANSDEAFTQRVAAEIDRQQALASPAPTEAAEPEASPSPETP